MDFMFAASKKPTNVQQFNRLLLLFNVLRQQFSSTRPFIQFIPLSFLLATTVLLIPQMVLAQDSANFSDSMEIWQELQSQYSSSSSSISSSTAVLAGTCECPITDPTTDNCSGKGSKRTCEREGCAKVIRGGEVPRIETAECEFGSQARCTCDPNSFDPPLTGHWHAQCEKDLSQWCTAKKCELWFFGRFHSRTDVPCGT